MKPTILFFGDSYANCGRSAEHGMNQRSKTEYSVYADIVSDELNMDQLIFGFGGASWWYSRCRMMDYFKENLDVLGRVEIVIAMHTNAARINTAHGIVSDQTARVDYYTSDFYDARLHNWAQKQWFREFSSIFSGKKVINFFCYPLETGQTYDLPLANDLVGTIVKDPMVHITVSEFAGTQKQIDHALARSNDFTTSMIPHHNHMNVRNHQALAVQLLKFIQYPTRNAELDFSRFDVANPNYAQWPHGKYWTDD